MKEPIAPKELLDDIRRLVSESSQEVARSVNSALVSLYWKVGERIRTEILKESRGEYGQKIVHAVSAQLSTEFGDGYSKRNLWNMIRFAEVFPDEKIVYALRTQLSWTIKEIRSPTKCAILWIRYGTPYLRKSTNPLQSRRILIGVKDEPLLQLALSPPCSTDLYPNT